jgi:hypothetical protein
MIIFRQSPLTGKVNKMDLPITIEQMEKYDQGALIQDAFPELNTEQREFYKTGYTQEDWDTMFPPEDE